jgi:threonylcarbamoyladenosine tRNA methylthiotransferase CDKAL1
MCPQTGINLKIYYEAYGCTLSKAESGLYVNSMLADGSSLVNSPNDADISIINTCVVIKGTEDRMIQRISELTQSSKVKVLGCLSTVNGGSLADPNIEVLSSKEFRSFYSGKLDDIEIREPSIMEGIPINQGCTGSCNFCISRVARGKLISRPVEKITGQVKMQLARGMKEVRITSLDTAAYGKDINVRLPDLVRSITALDDDFRLRIGMMEPKNTSEILTELLDSMRSYKVFKFLHIPVQSGDDRILDAMNREYSVRDFLKTVSEFRNIFPNSVLSTDLITGYHGEDQQSFENSLLLLEKTKPEICNITRFSQRPFTPDYEKSPPPSNIVKKWTKEMSDFHRTIIRSKLESQINSVKNLLITERGKNDTWVGRDDAYRPVVVTGDLHLFEKVSCEIVSNGPTYLIGKLI